MSCVEPTASVASGCLVRGQITMATDAWNHYHRRDGQVWSASVLVLHFVCVVSGPVAGHHLDVPGLGCTALQYHIVGNFGGCKFLYSRHKTRKFKISFA